MATTTNYSWSTPDDTALVKDGAAAIRSLGTAIDSTVFTNAGAAINKTIVDAAGDLIYGTAADTAARLALGTAGQVLTVNSGATAPEWTTISAGGMTLLSTTTLSGASTTISGISSAYTNLQIYIYGVTGNSSDAAIRFWFNSDTGGGFSTGVRYYSGTPTAFGIIADRISLYNIATLRTNSTNAAVINISNYSNTSGRKPIEIYGYAIATGTTDGIINQAGYFQGTAAVSSVTFDYGGTNTFAGGTVLIYGVK